MKNRIKIISFILTIIFVGGLSSCNKYLDTMPDNRTEIDSHLKVKQLLVSAYSNSFPVLMFEFASDNYVDNGRQYNFPDDIVAETYNYHNITSAQWDSPNWLWANTYQAISTANLALESIEKLGSPAELEPYRGEALICRAYGHFMLVNIFCHAYNAETSTTDMGIPYALETEKVAIVEYNRGTVAEVYKKIEADIIEGLPLIQDQAYAQPLYHFNLKAANAFAAQFYLFYGDYEKSISHATAALGGERVQTSEMRDMKAFDNLNSRTEYTHAWVDSSAPANYLIQTTNSIFGSMYGLVAAWSRYGHSQGLCKEQTLQSQGPWGTSLKVYDRLFSVVENSSFPKCDLFRVTANAATGSYYPYGVCTPFTLEKTLINRAEAYALTNNFTAAAQDLSDWYVNNGGSASSATSIISFYNTASTSGHPVAKPLNPRLGMTLTSDQTNMIHACLHARRIETMHEGFRWMDLKRYGISFVHNVDNGQDIVVEPFDNRMAFPLPSDVVSAGLPQNPR